MTDIQNLINPTAIPEPEPHTINAIYAAYEAKEKPWESVNIGLGDMTTECDRRVWYKWHWCNPVETFSGQKLRLFQTGHREEARILEDLRLAGVTVQDRDKNSGKQFKVEALGGHVQGRLDAIGIGFPEAPTKAHVVEVKTHNSDSFKDLCNKKVKEAKPGHYFQMQGYMHLTGYDRAAYVAYNKNETYTYKGVKNAEPLYFERVEYDPIFCMGLFARMERIVKSEVPPAKMNEDVNAKTAFMCWSCPSVGVCHRGDFARVNCRTCLHSTANTETGGWECAKHDRALTREEQQVGCSNHLFIPGLVPGEQVDTNPDAETVTYRLADGTTWIDGPASWGPSN